MMNFLNSIDTIYLWFVLLIIITWITARRFYKQEISLRSKKEYHTKYTSKQIAKKTSEIDSKKIQTYPRFTMYDISIRDTRSKQMIFDSSDFEVINYAFEVVDSLYGKTILTGSKIKFRREEYVVEKVEVYFLNIFDDYSINPFGGRHTDVYEGMDVPYNIQIVIEANRI